MPRRFVWFVVSTILVLVVAPSAHAVIMALLPLQQVIRDSQFIVFAKVERMYPDKPAMLLTVEEDLKGKLPFRKLPVHLKGGPEAEKLNHVPQLLKRLEDGLPMVLHLEVKNNKLIALAYTNGTWMQFVGDKTGESTSVWSLTQGEPYLRRTFKGSTDELRTTLVEVLAGKKRAPQIDEKVTPGFGPEVGSK